MEIDYYFSPVEMPGYEYAEKTHKRSLGDVARCYLKNGAFPSLEGIDIAIIGVPEERNGFNNEGCSMAPDQVREYLYALYESAVAFHIADLGNIKP